MALTETNANRAAKPARKRKDGKENAKENAIAKAESSPSNPPPRKRKSVGGNDQDYDGGLKSPSVNEDDCFSIEFDCDEIRSKVKDYLVHNKMRANEFHKVLHVTPMQLMTFMALPAGPGSGLKNKTFAAAHQFFTQQESAGQDSKSTPTKKRKTNNKANDAKSNDQPSLPETNILPELEGESDGTVEVYDTCNHVRTKIDAHLRKYNLTKVAFAKAISPCQAYGSTPVTPYQITKFQRKNGPLAGNSTKAFYASYVYFEKLRLHEGKAKSRKRQEMEEVHGFTGVMTDRPIENVRFVTSAAAEIYVDQFGRPRCTRGFF